MSHSPSQRLPVCLRKKRSTCLRRTEMQFGNRARAVAGPGDAYLGKVLLLQLPLPPCAAKSMYQPAHAAPLRAGTSADVIQSLPLSWATGAMLQARVLKAEWSASVEGGEKERGVQLSSGK